MKCFKHLCAKLFLCFVFFAGLTFVSDVNAAEITDATGTVEDAATQDTIASEAANTAIQQLVTPEVTVDQAQAALAAAFAEARAQDVDRLSRIIQTEAGNTIEDKVCVGLTVLHRVDSPKFPNTVEENINAPGQYAKPTKGEVLPENLMAAECAMKLWESGLSYAVLPEGFLYFVGNGRDNKFHDFHGHNIRVSEIKLDIITPYTKGPDGALIF